MDNFLIVPEVSNLDIFTRAGNYADFTEVELELSIVDLTPVGDRSDDSSTSEFSSVNSRRPDEAVPCGAVDSADSLLGVGVLVDCDELGVGEDSKRVLVNGSEVTADDQRSFGNGPESEMSLFLFVSHATISDL